MAQLQSTSITGSLIVTQGITGSFSGSITNAVSASYAATASYALNAGDSVWTGSAGNIYYSGGNVGIGTTSPSQKLDVNGYTVSDRFYPRSSNNVYIYGDTGGLSVQGSGYFYVPASGGSYFQGTVRFRSAIQDDTNAYFTIQGGTSGVTYFSGNVGIGATTPLFNLQVGANAGTIATTTIRLQNSYLDTNGYYGFNIDAVDNGVNGHDLRFLGRTNPTSGFSELVRIKNGGNVGIGTSNPTSLLELLDSGGEKLQLDGNEIYHVNDSPFYLKSSGDIVFQPDATTYVTFKETGNVGIGITNPIASLDNQGSAGTYRQRGVTTVVTDTLGASGTQARRFEIARASIDYNDWNSVGPIEIELFEKYFNAGLRKKYYVYYGYVSNSGVNLTEMTGYGTNNFRVVIGSEVVISGDNRYIPIYVEVREYSQVTAILRTNRELSTSNPPGIGGIWVNNAPTGTNISDFTADSVVYVGNLIGGNSTFSTGNVGIGATSPTEKLDVDGNIRIRGNKGVYFDTTGAVGSNYIAVTNDYWTSIYCGRGNTSAINLTNGQGITFFENTLERMRIAAGGNVGIGVTNPSAKLDVYGTGLFGNTTSGWYVTPSQLHIGGTGTAQISLEDVGVSTAAIALDGNVFAFGHQNSGPVYQFKYSNTYNGDYANTGTTFVQFNPTTNYISSGNVGIGTTSPPDQLSVGKSTGTSISITSNFAAGSSGSPLNIDLNFRGYADNKMAMIRSWDESASTGNGNLTFWTNNPGVSFAERMRITPGGNVGIGTTSPSTKLHVEGGTLLVKSNVNNGSAILTIKSSDDYGYTFSRNNTTGFLTFDGNQTGAIGYVFNNGNVGIGTASPSQKLEVAGYGLFQSGVVGSSGLTLYGDNSSPRGARLTTAGSFLLGDTAVPGESAWFGTAVFGKNGTDKVIAGYLTSNTNGAVIGGHNSALTAWAPIHIDGTEIRFNIQESRAATINSSGNVGIGITNPAYKLDVIGNTRVYGSYLVVDQTSGYNTSIILNQSGLIQWYMTNQASTGKLVFGNGNGDLVWIGTTGNVGIGTASPTAPLDTNGVRLGRNWAIANRADIRLDSNGSDYPADILFGHTSAANQTGWDGVYWSLSSRAASLSNAFTIWRGAGNPGGSGEEILFTILPGGNVGIGTSSPSTKLDVAGGIISTGTYQARMIGGAGGAYFGSMTAVPVIFQVNQNEVSRFDTNGNLGIGTTSPASRLHVYNDSDVWHTRIGGGSGELRIGGQTANGAVIQAYTPGGSQRDLYIQRDGGTVGIGTFSPTAILQINGAGGNGTPTLRLISTASDTFNWASTTEHANLTAGETSIHLIGKANSQYNQAYIGYRHVSDGSSSNMLTLGLYAADYLVNILGNGNVGIGTTSPGYKLDIAGEGRFGTGAKALIGTDGTYAGYSTIGFGGTTNGYNRIFGRDGTADGLFICSATGRDIFFRPNGGTTDVFTVGANGYLYSNSYLFAYEDASYNRLYRPNGTVGIFLGGAGDPGNFYDNTTHNFRNSGGGTFYAVINSSGNLGIGTTSPAQKLSVAGNIESIYAYGKIGFNVADAYGDYPHYGLGKSDGSYPVNLAGYYGLTFGTGGVQRMAIDGSGNVGIGTTSPSRKLDVAGDMTLSTGGYIYGDSTNPYLNLSQTNGTLLAYGSTSQLYLAGSVTTLSAGSNYLGLITNGSERMRITSGGNVGIGVTAPQAKLQVSGSSNVLNVRGSGSLATSSIFSVDGNNGRLFEVSDDLSNSLFSVNTIAGLPVIEAFADYTVTMGTYGAYTLQVTGSRVGVGTSSPGYPLHVSGSVSGISIYATNDIAAFSDQSVKTDLQVIDSAVDRIKQINGYTYIRVDDLSNTRRAGVIAQEVQKVLPEVVSENQDGTLNVAYQNMIALLIEGMKEQQVQIDELKQRLDNL